MKQRLLHLSLLLPLLGVSVLMVAFSNFQWDWKTPTAQAQESSTPESGFDHPEALEVLRILKHRCDQCHGPHIQFPQGGFGPMEQLPAWLNQGWISPGNTDQSPLLTTIHPTRGNMPPTWARNGKLTQEEYQLISQWVTEGAKLKLGQVDASTPETVPTSAAPVEDAVAQDETERLLLWLGKFHPALVHFPIALLLVAFIAELLYLGLKKDWLLGGVRLCLIFAVPGAVFAAATGLMWSGFKTPSDHLDAHEWAGILTTLCAIITLILNESRMKYAEKNYWHWIVRGMLLLCAFFVSAAGYYGSMMSRGENFHAW